MTSTATPFSRPLYVMLKPASAACNLHCKYCYYLEKSNLYKKANCNNGDGSSKAEGSCVMNDELLERFTEQYINAQTLPRVLFTWHGGEPLLRPLSFYKKAMALQRKYANSRQIDNCIQTNGTLLTDEWCEFFAENHWLVGISIDGPQRFHDEYRRSCGGEPTWEKVMKGIRMLNKHGVEWNAMAVVNNLNADYPLEFYHFFKSIGAQYLQFSPIVERIVEHADGRRLANINDAENAPLADFSVTSEQWGDFLIAIFDEWVKHDVGNMFVEIFDCTLANWVGQQPGLCVYARDCGHAGVMEFNGDVYSCDHFVFPEYRLGNIYDNTLIDMLYNERQQRFSNLKHGSLPRQCNECKLEFVCHGECPKNRFTRDCYGNPGLNYLCKGYYNFFEHAAPYMEFMKRELLNGRAPANIMRLFTL